MASSIDPTKPVSGAGLALTADVRSNFQSAKSEIEALQAGAPIYAAAAGTVDVITATLTPTITAYANGQQFNIRASGANTSTTPTINIDSVGAKTIVKLGNQALLVGNIPRVDFEMLLRYNSTNDNFELLNPSLEDVLASTTVDDGTTGFNLVYYPPKTGEVGVVNYQYYYGWLLRYGTNTTPGTTDMTTAWASMIGFSGGKFIPAGRYLVSSVVKEYETDTFINTDRNNHSAGYLALELNATGENNTAYGGSALKNNEGALPLASNNSSFGYQSMLNNTGGYRCAAFGYQALYSQTGTLTTGNSNNAFGYQCLYNNTLGKDNTANGYLSMFFNTEGGGNVASGYRALYNNIGVADTTGSFNVGMGYETLLENTYGNSNTAIGWRGMFLNAIGGRCTAIGQESLRYNSTVSNQTAIGYKALSETTTRVAALGSITAGSGYTNGTYNGVVMSTVSGATFPIEPSGASHYPTVDVTVSGGAVTVVSLATKGKSSDTTASTVLTVDSSLIGGTGSGFSIPVSSFESGSSNTALGYQSLTVNTIGSVNTALGENTLVLNTSGGSNTAVGYQSLSTNSTGSLCTAVGRGSLKSSTNNSNSALGYNAGSAATSGTNNGFFGNNSQPSTVGVSNEITLGDANIATLRCQVTTITALSDARDKTNIVDLDKGLDFIKRMRPVIFDWDRRDGSYQGVSEYGFIAQDLLKLEEDMGTKCHTRIVLEDNPNKLEASPMRTYPILIKAIQQLSDKNDSLEKRLLELENK